MILLQVFPHMNVLQQTHFDSLKFLSAKFLNEIHDDAN